MQTASRTEGGQLTIRYHTSNGPRQIHKRVVCVFSRSTKIENAEVDLMAGLIRVLLDGGDAKFGSLVNDNNGSLTTCLDGPDELVER